MLKKTISSWRAHFASRFGVPLAVVGLLAGVSPMTPAVAAQAGTSTRYIVVLKAANDAAGRSAIARFGGKLLNSNRLGIAVADSSDPAFANNLRASGKVDSVARDAAWRQASVADRTPLPMPGPETITGCANQYNPPGGSGVGPDPLSVCQWDMRMINASPTGSYAANQGLGARVGILDTGLDVNHPDIAPNLNLAESCSFILPNTPTSLPQEWEADPVNCPTKSAVQDYFGHGTHVGGTVAAPINGIGVAGVAPRATLIGLHAGTADGGYFFTSSVVNGLIYAGVHHLDVVNMSFFADPFLFNCKNDPEQKAIVKAITRAAQFANQNGVVLVAAAGNEANDLDHPTIDEISPDFPPDAAVTRQVGNNCVTPCRRCGGPDPRRASGHAADGCRGNAPEHGDANGLSSGSALHRRRADEFLRQRFGRCARRGYAVALRSVRRPGIARPSSFLGDLGARLGGTHVLFGDRDQFLQLIGLGEALGAAGRDRGFAVADHRVGGNGYHRDVGEGGVGLEGTGRLPAIHLREGEIHQDQARLERGGHRDRFATVARQLAAEAARAQDLERHLLHCRVVFDYEDQLVHAAAPCVLLSPSIWRTALVSPFGSIEPLATNRWM